MSIRVALIGLLVIAAPARAFPPRLFSSGQRNLIYGAQVDLFGGPGSGYKCESKLFYTPDGRWWAVLGSGNEVALHVLDASHLWQRRVGLPGADPWAKADTLLVGTTLYIALRDNGSLGSNHRESVLYSLSYLGNGSWTVPAGPTRISTANMETLTIARDSRGRLWSAYESGGMIHVGSTAPGETSFTDAVLPAAVVNSDDIAAVTAFGGTATSAKIGVLWSDQPASRFRFAWRDDGSPIAPGSWHVETAYGAGVGGCTGRCGDDHIDIKVTGDGLYAAVKTNLDLASDPSAPLIVLLRRDARGVWTSFPVSPVADDATRPALLLSPALNRIWVFARKGRGVYAWESQFTAPGFDSAGSVRWTRSVSGTDINDPTTTRQAITAWSGAVVEASLEAAHEYWHNEFLPQ
jgi:hypothetical protein